MSLFRIQLFLAAAAICIAPTPTAAFSPEIFNQVLVQLGSVTEYYGNVCPDELAFAAANLLDPNQQKRRNLIPLLIPPAASDNDDGEGDERRGILPSGSSIIQIPTLLAPRSDIYDYENALSSSSQSIPGILDLTPQEEELIQLIWKVRNKFSPRTTIRIAGGWVRDKLIYGKETPSRDVDLVLSDVSGKEFAEFVCRYVEEREGEESTSKSSEEDDQCDGGAMKTGIRIQQPSGSSKGEKADQLQNASLMINGFEVDFCRLRYEKYDKDSRIPVSTRVGSVVEDAWRRDLTINCLYYNIGSNQVEDFTECGVRDLILQQIDTPKNPLRTLLEDPTRILRAIRFASQLSFDVSIDLLRAARDGRVRSALQSKVSRDAIGKCIDEMLGTRARDPVRGIQLLIATNLIDVVFPLGGRCDPTVYKVGLEYLSRTQSLVTRIFLRSPELKWDIEKRRFLWYAAFLKPVHELMPMGIGSKSKRRESSFYQLLDVSLKRPKVDVQSIESILEGVKPIQMMMLEGANNVDAIQSAIKSGARLADASPRSSQWKDSSELRWNMYSTLNPIGAMWKEAVILALALSRKNINDCVDQYRDLVVLVEDQLQLKDTLLGKNKPVPLLNGSEIRQRALRGEINGRDFRRVVEAMEEWQIRNVFHDPEGVDDDDRKEMEGQLIDHLVASFPEYAGDAITSRSMR